MARFRSAAPSPMRARVRQGLMLVASLGLFVVAVVVVGKLTRDDLRTRDRYAVTFTDIDCTPPAGQQRSEFLTEVQYLAGLPERLRILDADLASQLAEAFGRHPWVEKVERIAVLPPRDIQVRLVYRTPVLAVLGRAVDQHGILLPSTAELNGLPVLCAAIPPAGPSGKPWGDASVEAAATTAAYLRSNQDRLHLEYFTATDGGLELHTPSGSRVLWGRPPGGEGTNEAAATLKLQRLLEFCKQNGSLGAAGELYEHDVRPRDRAVHGLLN